MAKRRAQSRQSSPVVRYVVVALGIVVIMLGLVTTRQANAHHPAPRSDLTGAAVASADRYVTYPRVAQVYEMAAEIPEVLDGLYCYCDCSRHSNHRSLLTCFQDDHGASCDVCLNEAETAYRMTSEGRSLKEIRAAVDEMYRR